MRVKPITPSEAKEKSVTVFPDEVIESFNELIIKNYTGGKASVKQDDVVALACSKMDIEKSKFDWHWLDVEDYYRQQGWVVEYDKPGYNETYPAVFYFKARA